MVGVMGPALGVIAALAFTGAAYGFAGIGYAALHRNATIVPTAPRAWLLCGAHLAVFATRRASPWRASVVLG